jgi:predicted NBD/HSP70 family sugar kinase
MEVNETRPDLSRFLVSPRVTPPLDPLFRPSVLARRELARAIAESRRGVPVSLAVERPGGSVWIRDSAVFEGGHPDAATSYAFCERLIKSMLWSRGGCRIWVDGPADLVDSLRRHYQEDPAGRFDARTLAEEVYGTQLDVIGAPRSSFPATRDETEQLGGHLDGCRIGFDLGASDRKAAAVVDGEVVFSEEIRWDPSRHEDPQWHFDEIMDSLRRAAAHLPRVDAIGGSAAGIYLDSEVRVASLFRSVPRQQFEHRVRGIFHELGAAWGGIPFVVVNDGEVTALAGASSAGVGSLLGVAMGSSEAAGYVRPDGGLTSWLNELAFTPIDYRADAPKDEWSGDRGCGVQYLSQQAVARLLPSAGIQADPASSLPERLVLLQESLAAGDPRALRVYETLGTYLGYALLDYRECYDFGHVLILGRVTTGPGGEVINARAQAVIQAEAPDAAGIKFHAVSERDKRHGQAVAAASLPNLNR